jgi:S-adenosylmethionine synthetase
MAVLLFHLSYQSRFVGCCCFHVLGLRVNFPKISMFVNNAAPKFLGSSVLDPMDFAFPDQAGLKHNVEDLHQKCNQISLILMKIGN